VLKTLANGDVVVTFGGLYLSQIPIIMLAIDSGIMVDRETQQGFPLLKNFVHLEDQEIVFYEKAGASVAEGGSAVSLSKSPENMSQQEKEALQCFMDRLNKVVIPRYNDYIQNKATKASRYYLYSREA
jgi:rubrerythrin